MNTNPYPQAPTLNDLHVRLARLERAVFPSLRTIPAVNGEAQKILGTIAATVCTELGVKEAYLKSARRDCPTVLARQSCFYIASRITVFSGTTIAHYFCRKHGAVSWGVIAAQNRADTEPAFARILLRMEVNARQRIANDPVILRDFPLTAAQALNRLDPPG